MDKFRRKFHSYIDKPTVLDVKDRRIVDDVVYLPLYAAPAMLEIV